MNRYLTNDFGRQPGSFGIRRVDNENLQTTGSRSSIAGNHPVVTASHSAVARSGPRPSRGPVSSSLFARHPGMT